MLETLVADDDFPEDDFSGCDPNAETVIMPALADPEGSPNPRSGGQPSKHPIFPGEIASRLFVRLEQGPYTPYSRNRLLGYGL